MSFLRKGMLVSGASLVNVPIHLIAGIILARGLGPDGLGQFELFRSTALIVVTICALGIGNANIYFINNRQISAARIATNTVQGTAAIALLLIAGFCTYVLVRREYFGAMPMTIVAVFACGVAVNLFTLNLRPVLVAQLAARRMVSVDLLSTLILLAGAGVLVLTRQISPPSALVLAALSCLGPLLLVLWFLRPLIQVRSRFDAGLFARVIGHGVKLAAANLLAVLSLQLAVQVLREFAAFHEVGLYTRATAVAGLVILVPASLGQLLYAKWSSIQGEARTRQAEMAARMSVAYGAAACVGLLLAGKYLIWMLYGQKFIGAYGALVILAPAMLVQPLIGVGSNLLAGDGRAGTTALVLVGTVALTFTTLLLTIPHFGMRGAALGVLVGNVSTALALLTVCARLYGFRLSHALVLKRSDIEYVREALLLPRKRNTVEARQS